MEHLLRARARGNTKRNGSPVSLREPHAHRWVTKGSGKCFKRGPMMRNRRSEALGGGYVWGAVFREDLALKEGDSWTGMTSSRREN